MNKIITINLGGIAIQIEEDAYDALRDYLKSLEMHFKGTENAEEILSDIENRIAEMLYEKLKVGKVSINKADVREVAADMGNPSELDAEEPEAKDAEIPPKEGRKIKRLFRDMDDRKVAGVCSGIAKYLDIDVTLVRIIWLVLFFVFGTGFLIYILLWAILPEAKTAAEKLEMVGEVPNVENIKNTIRDEAGDAYQRIKDSAEKGGLSKIFSKGVAILVALARAFAKFFGIIIVLAVLIFIASFFIRFFTSGHWFNWDTGFNMDIGDFSASLMGAGPYWLVKICLFLAIVIPLLYLLVRILISLIGAPRPNRIVKQGVVSIWLTSILAGFGGMVYGMSQIKNEVMDVTKREIQFEGDTLTISVSDFQTGELVEHDREIQLDVVQGVEANVFVEIEKGASGKSNAEAELGITSLAESMRMSGNTLLLHEKILSAKSPKTKKPHVKYTIYVPEGIYVAFHLNTREIIHNIENRQDVYDSDMAGKTFLMTSSGLSCMDCGSEYSDEVIENNSADHIEHIEISGALRVEIIEDGTNRIVYPKDKKWRESLDVELKSNILELRRIDDFDALLDWFSGDGDLKIEVHTSGLKSLEVDGACAVRCSADYSITKEYFELDARGANKIEITGLNAFKTSSDISGTNKLTFQGETNIFLLESDGASSINASEFVADNINVDISGAAVCRVNAIKEITGNVDGAGKLTYRGNPDISVKSRGMAAIKRED